jgi:hypothetical protein
MIPTWSRASLEVSHISDRGFRVLERIDSPQAFPALRLNLHISLPIDAVFQVSRENELNCGYMLTVEWRTVPSSSVSYQRSAQPLLQDSILVLSVGVRCTTLVSPFEPLKISGC